MTTYAELLAFAGISEAIGRFLLCLLATIPISLTMRIINNVTVRHLFSAASGLALSFYCFGTVANVYFAAMVSIAYIAMLMDRKRCRMLTFTGTFGLLIFCHVWYSSGEAWQDGGLDFTGSLMLLTLKAISVATDYQDGLLPKEALKETQEHSRLMKLPTLLEYVAYSFNCGSHFAGPICYMKDYLDWQKSEGIWSPKASQPPPNPTLPAIFAFLQSIGSVAVYFQVVPLAPVSIFSSPEYKTFSFFKCFSLMYFACTATRFKYYFIWSLAECAAVLSGVGFSGWKEVGKKEKVEGETGAKEGLAQNGEAKGGEEGKAVAKWDRAKNCNILGVELADSSAQFPLNWNISVSNWLRVYVYDRLTPKGKKGGLKELMATQVVSAVWHGLYPGYFLYFINSALFIGASRTIYRNQKKIPASSPLLVFLGRVGHGLYASFCNNYGAAGFIILSGYDTMVAYAGVYYAGTLVPIAIIASTMLKPARKASRPKKEA
eukprot:TRINITY_DN341_c0_g1_i1.p1 TRINITY_DN341_c0_g1~~TRINITY_DN341_c0_g1_i1.p1  ORF type:complete len:490 (+),score=89.12 TRINITY_DN341_c0_g1_i1:303-1772(+)